MSGSGWKEFRRKGSHEGGWAYNRRRPGAGMEILPDRPKGEPEMLRLSGWERAACCALFLSVMFLGCRVETPSVTTPPAPRPTLTATPEVLYNETTEVTATTARQGGCELASVRLKAGSALMSFTTMTSAGWIYANPATGSLPANASIVLEICLAPNELPLGDNSAMITVTAAGYPDQLIRATFRLE